jgi:GxxExxY protein
MKPVNPRIRTENPQMTQMDADGEDFSVAGFPHGEETYRILGACFEVYNDKGCGFLEPVYQECLELELDLQAVPFVAQKSLRLVYKGHALQHTYEPDFLCFDRVVVEIKAVSALTDEHRAQLLNYLNATGYTIGLLVNFGHYPKLEYERLIDSRRKPHLRLSA